MREKRAFLALLVLTLTAGVDKISLAQHEATAIALDGGCSAGEGSAACEEGGESLGLLQKAPAHRLAAAPLPPLGFLKTHKTGGSTMTNILHRLVERRRLALLFPNQLGMVDWRSLWETVLPEHQFDVLCNHNIFNETAATAYLKCSPFFFTILREPVAATDSRFRFLLPEMRPWPSRLVMMSREKSMFSNPFARDLGWYGVDTRREEATTPPGREANSSAVAAFVEHMDRVLGLVLLTEHFDEGVVLLRRRLGLSMEEVTYIRMKVTWGGPPVVPTPEERSVLLREFFSVDAALYEHFRRRFWREWEAAGGDSVLAGELAELKERNVQLARACAAGDVAGCPLELLLDNVEYTERLRVAARAAGLPSA